MRIDKLLWCLRYYKTRSISTEAVKKGHITVNGQVVKASRELAGDVGGERGLAHAAFLVEQSDDHGAALRVGKPGCCCCFSCPSFAGLVVVHRGAALLLPVRVFKLGKLREAETRASIGFAGDGHA